MPAQTPPRPERAPRISRVAGRQHISLLLAASGQGSVPQCERLVIEGRVRLNGRPVSNPLARADPSRDRLSVDGQQITLDSFCRYVIFHKPYRVLSSFTDPESRATVGDYVPLPDVYAVGRLDYDSEGLMLLTDDGWLNHRLTHPRHEHPKTYWVQVERVPDEADLELLRRGVIIKGRRTRPAEATRLSETRGQAIAPRSVPIRSRQDIPTAWLRVVLREGRKRQVRHMTAAIGFPTLRLIRVGIGPLTLGDLPVGAWRDLMPGELVSLARMAQGARRGC